MEAATLQHRLKTALLLWLRTKTKIPVCATHSSMSAIGTAAVTPAAALMLSLLGKTQPHVLIIKL